MRSASAEHVHERFTVLELTTAAWVTDLQEQIIAPGTPAPLPPQLSLTGVGDSLYLNHTLHLPPPSGSQSPVGALVGSSRSICQRVFADAE